MPVIQSVVLFVIAGICVAGALLCLVGVALIMYAPRG
jgi:drug/metabolite transporter superfamily protein YnfA